MQVRASALLLMMPAALILCALMGCGGTPFKGRLDPGGGYPTPPPGSPSVTSLSPSSAIAGDLPFTLTVRGLNFTPDQTVEWDSSPLITTYVSHTEMRAQVPASAIARPDAVLVIVATSPPSSLNFGATFTVQVPPLSGNSAFTVSMLDIRANDMVWDPTSQKIYLSLSSSNGANSNTIVALNPINGQLGISQDAGSEPDRLAIASDGSYLYAGIDGNGSVQRLTLPNLGMDINIPLGSYTAFSAYHAMDIEAAPGNPHTIAVVSGVAGLSEMGGIAIYDDAVPRPASVPGADSGTGPIDSIVWNSNATTIYGIDTERHPVDDLYVLSIDPGGVRLVHDYHDPSVTATFGILHYDATTGYLYTDYGQVINPSTGAVAGSFPTGRVQGGYASEAVMVPDGKLNIAYFLGQTEESEVYGECALEAFDLTNFTLVGAVPIPNVVGTPVKLIRWGSNGLALLTSDRVYLISGTYVTSPAAQN